MGHNSVVSGHPKSTGILWVDGLSTGPPDLGHHNQCHIPKDTSKLVQGCVASHHIYHNTHHLCHNEPL